jgi:phosphate transport system protein
MKCLTWLLKCLSDVQKAFDAEDTKIARGIFQKDDLLDEINENANSVIETYIRSHEQNISQSLHIISAVRKLERTGDQVKNVAEEIIFYLEAKVLKHFAEKEKL